MLCQSPRREKLKKRSGANELNLTGCDLGCCYDEGINAISGVDQSGGAVDVVDESTKSVAAKTTWVRSDGCVDEAGGVAGLVAAADDRAAALIDVEPALALSSTPLPASPPASPQPPEPPCAVACSVSHRFVSSFGSTTFYGGGGKP